MKKFRATIDCPTCKAAWQAFHKVFGMQRKMYAAKLKAGEHIIDHTTHEDPP